MSSHGSERVDVRIHAGGGGPDAEAWADRLCAMERAWAERMGCVVKLTERLAFTATGPLAYSLMRHEEGCHRLVRNSPFDPQHRRTTAFAVVEVQDDLTRPRSGQRRSYVLDPYTLVQDHHSDCEVEDVHAVLAGDLSAFWGGGNGD